MSQEVFMRGMFSGLLSLAFAWAVFSRQDEERTGSSEFEMQRYRPYVSGALLPMFLVSIMILAAYFYGIQGAVRMTLSTCFGIFLSICLYYPVLLLILPLLRKHISARSCAMLWLLPNYLYIVTQSYMELPSPLLVIPLKGNWVWMLLMIWFAGFALILAWKMVEHLLFRHQILAGASAVTDQRILSIWKELLSETDFKKPKFKLVFSPTAATPLTIGLFKRSTRIVLPDREYSNEELKMILLHELIHIGREDSWSKFFMIFCAAMCWFNPLMWIAMRKSADDMELSCDETVLLNADEATRKQYALLLLDTAGDERGFTTCLSATANAMRYRLRSVTKPQKRHSGALIVGAAFFILAMTSGYVALAFDGNSGAEVLYQSGEPSDYSIRNITRRDDPFNTKFEVTDESAFHEYLAGLTCYDLTGNYSYSDSERYFTYMLDTTNGTEVFVLYDDLIKVVHLYGENRNAEYYYVPGGLDWDYLDSIIVAQPACNVQLFELNDQYGRDLSTYVNFLWKIEDGSRILLQEGSYPEGEYHGIFGYEPHTAVFSFNYELAAPFSVLVESWDYSESYTVFPENFTMELPDHPAHYTVCANFLSNDGTMYEAEFWFNIGDIES